MIDTQKHNATDRKYKVKIQKLHGKCDNYAYAASEDR